MNPGEWFDEHGKGAKWVYERAEECGAYTVCDFMWDRATELNSELVALLERKKGMGGKIGEES